MSNNQPQWSFEIQKSLAALADGQLDKLWEGAEANGIWIRRGDVPEGTSEELIESGFINDEARVCELEDGSQPTPSELEKFQQWWIERQFSGDDDNADLIPGYAIARIGDDKGQNGVALILRTGYSFTTIEQRLEGVFRTTDEAVQHMKAGGWCD